MKTFVVVSAVCMVKYRLLTSSTVLGIIDYGKGNKYINVVTYIRRTNTNKS